jgi:hypothetical protein
MSGTAANMGNAHHLSADSFRVRRRDAFRRVRKMSEIEQTLLEIEQRMLDADAAYDGTFFEKYCTDDFVAMGSYGVVSKEQVLDMYAKGDGNPNRRNQVQDPQVKLLGDGGALVIYKLTSTTGDETSSWYATTAYRRVDDDWRVVLLHQTPA